MSRVRERDGLRIASSPRNASAQTREERYTRLLVLRRFTRRHRLAPSICSSSMGGSGPSHEDQTLTHPRLKENDKSSERHALSGPPSLTTSYRHPVDILPKVIAKTAQAAVSHMISIRAVRLEVCGHVFYADYGDCTNLDVGRCR